jgi:hypothetical protein
VQNSPVAVLLVSREVEYGLGFYLDRSIARYDRDPAPTPDHLLVARTGDEAAATVRLPGRRVSHVGSFAPQKLELYWVSTPPPMQHGAGSGGMDMGSHHQH